MEKSKSKQSSKHERSDVFGDLTPMYNAINGVKIFTLEEYFRGFYLRAILQTLYTVSCRLFCLHSHLFTPNDYLLVRCKGLQTVVTFAYAGVMPPYVRSVLIFLRKYISSLARSLRK